MARSRGAEIIPSSDVLPRYMSMGHWKTKQLLKKGKASRTSSGVARVYVAFPPPEGWKGGDPRQNGMGAGKSKK